MSMRSSKGPEIFETYRWIIGGVQWHSRVGAPKYPQGQGFIAAASTKREGNVTDTAARDMVTAPSSSGGPSNNLPFDLFAGELLSDEMNMRKQAEGSFGGSGGLAWTERLPVRFEWLAAA